MSNENKFNFEGCEITVDSYHNGYMGDDGPIQLRNISMKELEDAGALLLVRADNVYGMQRGNFNFIGFFVDSKQVPTWNAVIDISKDTIDLFVKTNKHLLGRLYSGAQMETATHGVVSFAGHIVDDRNLWQDVYDLFCELYTVGQL